MAFDIDGALKAGYSPEEISQHLKFDYKGAVASGYSDDEILGHLSSGKVQPKSEAMQGLEAIEPSVAPGMQFCSAPVTTTETRGQALPLSLDPPQDAPSPAHACPTPTPPPHLK